MVTFEQREHEGPWHVLFEVDRADPTAAVHASFRILNGAFQAVEEFAQVRQPETVIFATKRDELAGIYQTYLRREAATLESLGYRLEGPHAIDPYTEFVLHRTEPSAWTE